MDKTKKLVTAALMAAFTCVATMVIKYPTPTLGYIHLGDGLVILSGIILGPAAGGLAAGIGSGFADLFSGYAMWVPGTFVIKALCAVIAGFLFRRIKKLSTNSGLRYAGVAVGGLAAELFMVTGYFFYEILIVFATAGNKESFAAAAAGSASGIPFNLIQGVSGVVIALVLVPVLLKVGELRKWILQ